MTAKLELRQLIKVFGRHSEEAVHLLQQGCSKSEVQQRTGANVGLAGVSAEFRAGEISCVMGLSGSGKSTLIRHINRLIDPTKGEVLLDGDNILNYSLKQLRQLRREKMSMVFQGFALLPHLTVLENVALGLKVRQESKATQEQLAKEWVDKVGLAGYEYQYPDELSGGMRQRVGLARALATDSDILLMDEAFSALDPLIRQEMQDQLIDLQQKLNKTIVFVTHDINEALKLGQHIVILREGRVEQAGTPQMIQNAPVNDYVAHFLPRKQS